MLRCDLHLHSSISPDCNMSLDTIIRTCLRRGIGCIALTDHNRLSNALALQRIAPFHVIPGEEIKTSEGEIIGLFLADEIPRGMTPGATVEAIRRQGGLIYIPHPFDRVRRSVLRTGALMEILDEVDVVEAYNSRITFPADIQRAVLFAREHGKLLGAGSDAHVWWELGNSVVEMPEFDGSREGFLRALAQGRATGKLTTPLAHAASSFIKWRKKYLRLSR